MKTKAKICFEKLPRNYQGLCQLLLPRPIRDDADYDNVTEIADAMVLRREDFSQDQADYFELLCSLLEEYDARVVKWPKVRGVNALKHLLQEQSMGAADLSRLLKGSRNLGGM